MLVTLPGKYAQYCTISFAFTSLLLLQVHKAVYFSGIFGLDFPMSMMFMYSKLNSLACNVGDGEVLTRYRNRGAKEDEIPLKSREKEYAQLEKPSLLDFVSYMYFCGSPISGPWFEYKDF